MFYVHVSTGQLMEYSDWQMSEGNRRHWAIELQLSYVERSRPTDETQQKLRDSIVRCLREIIAQTWQMGQMSNKQ